jgi:hypothetical protein
MSYCEDFPACGHTPLDPCERQPYDEPGYYDTTIRGNEHALCDHENGECNVDYDDEPEECEDEEHECVDCETNGDGNWKCSWCDRPCPAGAHVEPPIPLEPSMEISDRWYPR